MYVFYFAELNSRGLPHAEVVWSKLDAKQQELANKDDCVQFSANQRIVQPANQNATISSAFLNGNHVENHSYSSHNQQAERA